MFVVKWKYIVTAVMSVASLTWAVEPVVEAEVKYMSLFALSKKIGWSSSTRSISDSKVVTTSITCFVLRYGQTKSVIRTARVEEETRNGKPIGFTNIVFVNDILKIKSVGQITAAGELYVVTSRQDGKKCTKGLRINNLSNH